MHVLAEHVVFISKFMSMVMPGTTVLQSKIYINIVLCKNVRIA
jgi:hypothetical protein